MFEWKLSVKSNSGFMWGVSEDAKYEHPYLTGPEIQILDAEVYRDDPQHQRNTVGALYDMSAPSEIVSNPAGSWNKYHITIDHNKNEAVVILNEIEINRFPLSGPEWDAMISNSKFKIKKIHDNVGDGKIFILPVEEAYRIRTSYFHQY